jgi:hypothetical protein
MDWGSLLNVANHLRQGYGGQDVKMLPITNTNSQLGNMEREIGNWKMELAILATLATLEKVLHS